MQGRYTLTMTALAAALALAACDRGDGRTARTDAGASSHGSAPSAGSTTTGQSGGTVSGAGTSAAPGTASDTPSGTGTKSAATGQLAEGDTQFVKKAAEGGMYEVEVARLAADKASDPNVKAFARMLVDDHTAANEKLREIASSHNVPIPPSLPSDRKRRIDKFSKLSGAQFDKAFVKEVGLDDHKHDIADFEKAATSAKADDVRDFATSTLPKLKKHLAAAEQLPEAGKG
jgi:putative membrane protein